MEPLNVLVVEPDESVSRVVAMILARARIATTIVHCAAEALERLAAGERYDAIVSAVMMRHPTGPEFFARARLVDGALSGRIVFLSGGVGSKEAAFLRSIPNRLVPKPFEGAELVAAIRDAASTAAKGAEKP